MAEANDAVRACLVDRRFGGAGERVLIEERLEGAEVSILALCDGETVLPLAPARDYKRALDGDRGPNTGGMGCISPVPGLDPSTVDELVATVHRPVIAELARRGIVFRGCLYAGLMLTDHGPSVLEFNARWGDPETQALVPRLDGDLLDALRRCAEGTLNARVAGRVRPGLRLGRAGCGRVSRCARAGRRDHRGRAGRERCPARPCSTRARPSRAAGWWSRAAAC